jgi:TolB-like protein
MAKPSLPEFIAPMQAALVNEPFDSPDWIFETKLDGYRAIAVIDTAGKARIWSRNRLPLESKFPMVLHAVDQLKLRSTILGEEIVALDQRLGASGKAIEVLRNLREVIAVRRVRLILWPALMLVIGGGAILAVNIFFGPKHPFTQTSKNSSPTVAAPENSIAVLPFESLSENKSDSYFADGIQDEILSNLAKVSQLRVISRTSVMTFRPDSNRDLRSIATGLDVAHVLEGTVRRYGNRVRITTELIDADKDKTLWSDSYDRDLTDIFAVQSEIAQTVVAKLSAELSAKEKQEIEGEPTDSLEAYDLYLQAKELIANTYLFDLKTPRENFLKAIGYLVQRVVHFQSAAMATKSSIHAPRRVKQALELNETVH